MDRVMTLMAVDDPAILDGQERPCPPRLSELLAGLAEVERERLSLQDLLTALGDRSFGSALLIMAVPATVMPPLVSALFGAPLLVVSFQFLLGRRSPQVPAILGRLSISGGRARKALSRASGRVSSLERLSYPRLMGALHPLHLRLTGIACLAMSLVMCLPTPMAHSAAGLSIGAFATGMLQRDGLALIAGWALALICAVLMALILAATLVGLNLL